MSPMKRGATRQQPETLWGQALEALRERRGRELGTGYSQYQLAKDANIPQSEYRNMLHRGVHGPSLSKIDSLLRAMHYTWSEWGIEYELAKQRAERRAGLNVDKQIPALKRQPARRPIHP